MSETPFFTTKPEGNFQTKNKTKKKKKRKKKEKKYFQGLFLIIYDNIKLKKMSYQIIKTVYIIHSNLSNFSDDIVILTHKKKCKREKKRKRNLKKYSQKQL